MNEHIGPDKVAPGIPRGSEQPRAFRWTGKAIALAVLLAIGATYYYMRAGSAPAVPRACRRR